MTEDTPQPSGATKPTPLLEVAADLPVHLEHGPPPAAARLMASLVRGTGDHTPYAHFATLAVIVQHLAGWIGRADGFVRRTRRHLLAGAGIAGVNLAAFGTYALNRHDEAVAARAEAADGARAFSEYRRTTDDRIEQLRLDVRELRRELRRMTGTDASGPNSDIFHVPDKVSLLDMNVGEIHAIDIKGPICIPLVPLTMLEPVTPSPLLP